METKRDLTTDKMYERITGTILFCVRVTLAWMYFSAFWRRVVLVPAKLDPASHEYIGMKFNSFMPHAFGMQPILEFLLEHGEILIIFLVIFTIIEGLCGLGLMFGFFTRLTSFGIMCLSSGILLGAGWLGNASYDEWMVGITGAAAAMGIFLAGGGYFSLDSVIFGHRLYNDTHRGLRWFTSGKLPLSNVGLKRFGFWLAVIALVLGAFTLQIFHNGILGVPFNDNVLPMVEVDDVKVEKGELQFEVYRPDGPDTYGAFIIKVELIGGNDTPFWSCDFLKAGQNGEKITGFKTDDYYISKVKVGKYNMEIPLGSRTLITKTDAALADIPVGLYLLRLTDVSGAVWEKEYTHEGN